jgi:hypothetical protein
MLRPRREDMRKLLAFAATVGLLAIAAVPAYANSGSGPPPNPTCYPSAFAPPGQPGTGPCTETDHFGTLDFLGSPLNCPGYFSGWSAISATGNGIQHITVNRADDFWLTSTFTGTATITPLIVIVGPPPGPGQPPTITVVGVDPARPSLSGHLETWFGISGNRSNYVIHDVGNFHGTSVAVTPVQSFSLHFIDHISSIPSNPFAPHTVIMDASC